MARKTFSVEEMKEFANNHLSRTDSYVTAEFKAGVCTMIERILMESGNYEGFSFLDNNDSEIGTLGYYSRHYS